MSNLTAKQQEFLINRAINQHFGRYIYMTNSRVVSSLHKNHPELMQHSWSEELTNEGMRYAASLPGYAEKFSQTEASLAHMLTLRQAFADFEPEVNVFFLKKATGECGAVAIIGDTDLCFDGTDLSLEVYAHTSNAADYFAKMDELKTLAKRVLDTYHAYVAGETK